MAPENYHHDKLKEELIEKGLKLLDQEGYEGFSLRKVAKTCNVSHAAPYRHFKNKDELILAIAHEIMDQFTQTLRRATDKYPNNPRWQLKEMGCAYIEFFTKNPAYLRLMFLSDLHERFENNFHCDSSGGGAADQRSEDSFGILSATVKRYQEEMATKDQNDSSPSIDQDAMLLYCWGLVHGIAILTARKEFPFQGDCLELARKVIWERCNF